MRSKLSKGVVSVCQPHRPCVAAGTTQKRPVQRGGQIPGSHSLPPQAWHARTCHEVTMESALDVQAARFTGTRPVAPHA